jgi:hypothetical protein
MVVSLALTGVVLALVSAIALRQQRIVDDLAEQREVAARLREASVLLPIQLRSAASTDLRDARDTSLELRATIATAIVCDTIATQLVLAPATGESPPYASFLSPIEAGDSVWLLAPDAAAPEWRGTQVTAVSSRAPAPCSPLGPVLSEAGLHTPRVALTVESMPATPIGLPVRVTRPMRYSLYRAGDGDWYLGEREWNNTLARFDAVQPVVGPFLKAGSAGLLFHYADSSGIRLPSPVVDPNAIALIDVELRAETRSAVRIFGSAAAAGKRVDSTLLTIALRGRR